MALGSTKIHLGTGESFCTLAQPKKTQEMVVYCICTLSNLRNRLVKVKKFFKSLPLTIVHDLILQLLFCKAWEGDRGGESINAIFPLN